LKLLKANGKLLISGEYAVLNGAYSLAIPTKYGQNLTYQSDSKNILSWLSFTHENKEWLSIKIDTKSGELISSSNPSKSKWLEMVIKKAFLLSSIKNLPSGEICAYLDFPNNWGLGSSSTLLILIAKLLDINPFELHFSCTNGSGYDIACGLETQPIIYNLNKGNIPNYHAQEWNPDFLKSVFFVHLNKKQKSNLEIERFNLINNSNLPNITEDISKITSSIINCNNLKEFELLLNEHEEIIGKVIEKTPIKRKLFKDYPGEIKSLGAWGGDFILATGPYQDYFKNKQFNTIIPYVDMIKRDDKTLI